MFNAEVKNKLNTCDQSGNAEFCLVCLSVGFSRWFIFHFRDTCIIFYDFKIDFRPYWGQCCSGWLLFLSYFPLMIEEIVLSNLRNIWICIRKARFEISACFQLAVLCSNCPPKSWKNYWWAFEHLLEELWSFNFG